jgi:hypothetical protein
MASIVVNGDTSGAVTLSAPATAGTVTVTLPATSGTMLTTASSTGISGSAISSGTVAEAYGGTGTNTGYYGFKSRIINGAMVIDQRNAGASVTPVDGQYLTDRWRYGASQTGKLTFQQNAGSVTAPVGFNNYSGLTSTSAYSITSTDLFLFAQRIEGFNFADLGFGTANAKTVTISFWVRSSLTGTFGGGLANSDFTRNYPFSYTISSANTWEQKTIIVAGDITGTWVGATNGLGANLSFGLGVGTTYSGTANAWTGTSNMLVPTGSVSVVGTNGATFYITGVQLEKGSTATSFDYRPYGTELVLCQRYYWKSQAGNSYSAFGSGMANSSTQASIYVKYPVTMRTTPTFAFSGTINCYSGNSSFRVTSTAANYSAYDQALWQLTCSGGGMTGATGIVVIADGDNNAYLSYSAEL